jgi:molybdopterin molybdotransferase
MNKARPFKELISLEAAQDRLFSKIKPIKLTEKVHITQAQNRILAKNVTANINVPPFSRAAMDGYATLAEDTYGASDLMPKEVRCIGSVYAGDALDLEKDTPLKSGECIKIATGAMLPAGADSVVMVEYAEENGKNGNKVLIHRPVHPGENISRSGSDIIEGSKPLSTGLELTASRLGALAALGKEEIEVYKKPRVAISGTGNEICPLGETLKPGQVYDINSYTLGSVVKDAGGEPVQMNLVNDTREALEQAFNQASKLADLIVFTGGSSVGERDLLIDVFSQHGEVLFHGVQLKPGKPVLAAVSNGKLCFGFPGYPTSCLTSALLFLAPVVRMLANRPTAWPRIVKARLSRNIPSTLGRSQVLTVKLENDLANPAFKESGAITSMAEADGYIIIPSNVDMMGKDDEVDVYLL